ncbi:MAG: PD40 domain-containing protein, partial [Candidatus Aminicenantes bacterium]|nr:PD40 domain-containing protein [Candidatus Aminicenantes bacterium]
MNKTAAKTILASALVLFLSPALLRAIHTSDTLMLHNPALSRTHVAFVYANDLWVAEIGGGNARRLTSDVGSEAFPAFSPDGSLIAFSAQYEGNTDAYVVPTAGGVPRRLTWHPGPDVVQGFTPDGAAVLFTSARAVFTGRYQQLFKVPVEGGFPEKLEIPHAFRAAYSPDGARLAYNPLYDAFTQWKHYRGGTVSVIWIYTFADRSVEKIPQPEGRSNDAGPMWIGDKIYFRSDRDGEFNIYSYDLKSKTIDPVTRHRDFPVLNASAGGGKIVYEQAGRLHLLNPETGTSTNLSFGVAADLPELRPRYVKGIRWIRDASLSPSGARAALEFRGDVVTVPAEKGDPRNLTQTSGIHERSPVWSPDGKTVAYVSDASGEYALHLRKQDGKGEARAFKLEGTGFYDSLVWSPDSKKLTYADNSWSLYWIDVETGAVTKIGSEYQLGPRRARTIHAAWSPDSQWIVYTLNTQTYIQRVYLYSLERKQSFPVTDGLSEVAEPVFDSGGKYLYFLASTDAGPVKQWFDQSSEDMRMTSSIYVLTLRKNISSPLAKESDEEKADSPEKSPAPDKAKGEPKKPTAPFSIDLEGLDLRIQALPVPAGNYRSLQPGEEGQLYYLESSEAGAGPFGPPPGATLKRFSFKDRKSEDLISNVNAYILSADKKKMLYLSRSGWFIVAAGAKPKPGQGKMNVEAVEVRIDPRAEWEQIFHEAWRINRDFFYADNMHGADWKAMREKYSPFLPHLACRNDLNRLIQWMCSELGVGHHRVGGGDTLARPETVPGGLFGADFAVENGRFRFKKVYGGLNWNPELRSPLTEPGVDVTAGEYLLAVNGRELRFPKNVYSLFENTAGKIVEITVGPDPSGKGSRTVKVVPVESEYALRNRDWVEGNLKKVEEATGGRVAYVYVPNTTTLGHAYFKRYFFPQAQKEAVIIDERFNGGGLVADYYIDHLRKPVSAYWHMRYGADLKTPSASIQGPKVMLIDETAGSGGDMLPWMFRKFGLGPLIGKRTWGGLVGTLGFPVLLDGA